MPDIYAAEIPVGAFLPDNDGCGRYRVLRKRIVPNDTDAYGDAGYLTADHPRVVLLTFAEWGDVLYALDEPLPVLPKEES